MKMKKGNLFLSIIIMTISSTSFMYAGTLTAGINANKVWWDSGMAKMTADAVENKLKQDLDQAVIDLVDFDAYDDLDVSDPSIHGFIFSPFLSYTTDNNKWQYTLDFNCFGNYTSSIDASVDLTADYPIFGMQTKTQDIESDIEIEQKDIRVQAAYNITDMLNVFAGYAFQSYQCSVKSDYAFTFNSSPAMQGEIDYSMESKLHMLFIGAGTDIKLSDRFSLNGSFAPGVIVGGSVDQEIKVNSTSFTFNNGKVESAYCIMGDIGLTTKIVENLTMNLGYQIQYFTFKVKDVDLDSDRSADDSESKSDLFQGITIGLAYSYNL